MFKGILADIKDDDRYRHGIKFRVKGRRKQSSVSNHITELEANLNQLSTRHKISEHEYWALMLLIHTHDTMKMHAIPHAKIKDMFSHSSLARDFAADYCRDEDLLQMIQQHEVPFSIYRKERKGQNVAEKLDELFGAVRNWRLFLMFIIIDNCISGGSRRPVYWIIEQANKRFATGIDEDWVID